MHHVLRVVRRGKFPRRAVLLFLALLVVVAGCQSGVAVTGKVVENGQPIAGAELRWAHETDKAVFGSGASDATGAYVVEAGGKRAIPAGKYQVTVTWWRTASGKPLPAGEAGSTLKGTPKARQWTAILPVEVTSGNSTMDLDVTGKATAVAAPDASGP